jgi:hypothetical protein
MVRDDHRTTGHSGPGVVTADTTRPFGIKISFHSERTVAAADHHHLR